MHEEQQPKSESKGTAMSDNIDVDVAGLHVAPTEPKALKALGRVSMLPERFGVDVFWLVRGQRHGVQRKELSDLLASVDDGRLGKELAQMRSAGLQGVVVVEGRMTFTSDGDLVTGFGRNWKREQVWGVELAIQQEGAWLVHTNSLADTIAFVRSFERWTQKNRHGSLQGRPAAKGIWGTKATDADFACHVLSSVPGIGQDAARKIFNAYGTLPLVWSGDWEELAKVKGLGPKRIGSLRKLFDADS